MTPTWAASAQAASTVGARRPTRQPLAAVQTREDGGPLYVRMVPVADFNQPGDGQVGAALPGRRRSCGQ